MLYDPIQYHYVPLKICLRAVAYSVFILFVNSMELHGIFHGAPWDSRELQGAQWKELYGIPLNSIALWSSPYRLHLEFSRIPKNFMEYAMECHGIPRNSTELHGIPRMGWNSMNNLSRKIVLMP